MKIGIRLESLGLSLRQALEAACQLGVGGVQVDSAGELAPSRLSQTGRRQFLTLLRSHHLELTALGCPLRRGLTVPEGLEQRLDHVRQVMQLAFDLGPRRVIVEAGPIAADAGQNRFLTESLLALGQHGDRVGTTLALETGLESGETMATFLAGLDTGSLGANLDPANLLIHGFDPCSAVTALARRIVHTHIKDARKSSASRAAAEVAVGHGDIDWMHFLDLLEQVDYQGWLTLERETGDRKAADIAEGVAFLRRLVPAR
jgi:sugar phosphate isomerase/epimerase